MSPAELPSRWRLAATQVRRGTFEAPWSAASWVSVLRRAVVVTGFFAYGLVSGQLDTAIFAAFGAVQIGLVEAALPFRSLVRLQLVNLVVLGVVAFAGASLGGTWWTVPLLALVAFVQGSTAGSGLVAVSSATGALAMGVIFAGLPDAAAEAPTAASWLMIGAATQDALWLLVSHWERILFVRRALANNVRGIQRLVRRQGLSGRDANVVSSEIETAETMIRSAGFGPAPTADALAVARCADELRRTAVTWRVLRQPGLAARLQIDQVLRQAVAGLDEAIRPAPGASEPPTPGEPEPWACDLALAESLRDLNHASARLHQGARPDEEAEAGSQSGPAAAGVDSLRTTLAALRPGSPLFRHGLRMAAAVVIAQTLAMLVDVGHSFWIPLTVVFVVKPDWSNTVIRSAGRVLGNTGAVILVPIALLAASGNVTATAACTFLLAAVMFRYFSGNYVPASFGVAGTILVLDQTLSPDADLYGWRILATLIGTAIALIVSIALPSWRSAAAPGMLGSLITTLIDWGRGTGAGLGDPASVDGAGLKALGHTSRDRLAAIRPGAEAGLIEPRRHKDARALVIAVEAAERAHLSLMALAFHARLLHRERLPGLDVATEAASVDDALTSASVRLGHPPSRPSDPWPSGGPPHSQEDLAVLAEAVRLNQAADDLAEAVSWMTADRPGGPATAA